MKVDYVARNFELDERTRKQIEGRLEKLGKFVPAPAEARVALEMEKFRFTCDLQVVHRHGELRATEESHDLRQAIDVAADALDKQARKARQKAVDRRRRGARGGETGWPVEFVESSSVADAGGPRVVGTERLPIKPMSLEEAALQLEGDEHGFVVFRDAASDKIHVLYRHKDGRHLGLIAPEL